MSASRDRGAEADRTEFTGSGKAEVSRYVRFWEAGLTANSAEFGALPTFGPDVRQPRGGRTAG